MKTVLVFGTFDVLHPGHKEFLGQARTCGDRVIASIARDSFVEFFKKKKPLFSTDIRIKQVLESGLVDEAYVSDEVPGSFSIIEKIKPDVICLGYDQSALEENLKDWLLSRQKTLQVVRLKPYNPDKYKSTKIQQNLYVSIDIETTGLDPVRDRIIELGAVLFDREKTIHTYESLIDPGIAIPRQVTEIHGITDEMVKGQRSIAQVLPEFLDFCKGTTVIAHNAWFDLSFLLKNISENKIKAEQKRSFLDTLRLSRKIFPELPSFSLKNLARTFKLSSSQSHRALEDAVLCKQLFLHILTTIDRQTEEIIRKHTMPRALYKKLEESVKSSSLDFTFNWREILENNSVGSIAAAIEQGQSIEISFREKARDREINLVPTGICVYNTQYCLLGTSTSGHNMCIRLNKIKKVDNRSLNLT